MKTFPKKTLVALTIVLFTQTLSAEYSQDASKALDVTKFSSVWQELNRDSKVNQSHLENYVEKVLENTTQVAYQECTPSIDAKKFSSLWQEIKTNNNDAKHLANALNTTVDEVICTVS